MPRLIIFTDDEIKEFEKPPIFSLEQQHHYFSFNDKLLLCMNNLKSPTNKIGMMLQWGYFRATGRFFSPADFQDVDIQFVADKLNIERVSININSYYLNRKTSREHEKAILNAMQFKSFNQSKDFFYKNLTHLIEKQMNPKEIIYYMISQLHQQKIEIPGYYTFVESITHAYNAFEDTLLNIIEQQITPEQIYYFDTLIQGNKEGYNQKYTLTKWKHINQSIKVGNIQISTSIFQEIKYYFNTMLPLITKLNLSEQASEYYAIWVKKAKLSQIKQFPNKTKLRLHLLAFIQHQFYRMQDALITIFIKSVQSIRNQATKRVTLTEMETRKERTALIEAVTNHQDNLEDLVTKIAVIVNEDRINASAKVNQIKTLLKKHDSNQNTKTIDAKKNRTRLINLVNDDE